METTWSWNKIKFFNELYRLEEKYKIKDTKISLSLEQLSSFLIIALSRLNIEEFFIKLYHSKIDFKNSLLLSEVIEDISIIKFDTNDLFLTYNELRLKVNQMLDAPTIQIIKDLGMNICCFQKGKEK